MATATTALIAIDRPLDAGLLERRVSGFGIADSSTLGSVLAEPGDDAVSLLVFLRHFG